MKMKFENTTGTGRVVVDGQTAGPLCKSDRVIARVLTARGVAIVRDGSSEVFAASAEITTADLAAVADAITAADNLFVMPVCPSASTIE